MLYTNKLMSLHKSKAAIYIRVSSLVQKEKRYGLDVQRDICKEVCNFKNYEIYKIYKDDGVSGTIKPENRPAMGELIKDAKNNKFQILVFYSLDRLSRDTLHALDFVKLSTELEIELKSCNENIDVTSYQGKFKLGFISLIAELEINIIKERLQGGRMTKKTIHGDIGGPLPYGFHRSDGNIVVNSYEEKIVQFIFSSFDSMNKIAGILNLKNIPTARKGKKWYASTIKSILKNREKYEGCLINNNINDNRYPKII